jgi:hypothetical protein
MCYTPPYNLTILPDTVDVLDGVGNQGFVLLRIQTPLRFRRVGLRCGLFRNGGWFIRADI